MAPGMVPKERQSSGPQMRLGNMCELGVHHLIAYCLNPACRHSALIDVSSYVPAPCQMRHVLRQPRRRTPELEEQPDQASVRTSEVQPCLLAARPINVLQF